MFTLPQYLKEHENIHNNALPFTCEITGCNRRFKQWGKLSLHWQKDHKDVYTKKGHKKNWELNEYNSTEVLEEVKSAPKEEMKADKIFSSIK